MLFPNCYPSALESGSDRAARALRPELFDGTKAPAKSVVLDGAGKGIVILTIEDSDASRLSHAHEAS